MKASMIATNYFTAQLNELHINHVGQLQELNGTIETQAKTIGSQERTIDDMSATISGLRKQVISLDTELQSFKTPASAKAGSKFEGTINAEAAKKEPATEGADAGDKQCNCPACQLKRALTGSGRSEEEEPSDEMPEGLRYFLNRMQTLGEDVGVMSAGSAEFDQEEAESLKVLAKFLKKELRNKSLENHLGNTAATLSALEKITSNF